MAVVNQIEKRVMMTTWEIVKYQLMIHCYLAGITTSDANLNCLTFLALEGEQELTSFCQKVYEKNIFSSPQSARNCITKSNKKGLILKQGKNKKKIFINPALKIQTEGNILLNLKILSVASKES